MPLPQANLKVPQHIRELVHILEMQLDCKVIKNVIKIYNYYENRESDLILSLPRWGVEDETGQTTRSDTSNRDGGDPTGRLDNFLKTAERMTYPAKILTICSQLTALNPPDMTPTPAVAPTIHMVVDTGIPN